MNPIETSLPKYIAFMAHLPIEHKGQPMLQFLEKIIQEYPIGGYIIGEETTPFNHYHFVVQMTSDDYHNFSQRIFKKEYKLRGLARGGLPRQYGKLGEVEKLKRMKAYTLKAGNFVTNLGEAEIAELVDMSFEKSEEVKFDEKICREIEIHLGDQNRHVEIIEIRLLIIKQLIKMGIKSVPTKGKINKIASLWYWKFAKQRDENTIYEALFGIHPY